MALNLSHIVQNMQGEIAILAYIINYFFRYILSNIVVNVIINIRRKLLANTPMYDIAGPVASILLLKIRSIFLPGAPSSLCMQPPSMCGCQLNN